MAPPFQKERFHVLTACFATQVNTRLKFHRVGSYYAGNHFPEEVLRSALSYKHRPGDVFIVTYPKCGTTWLQYIIYHIYTKGAPMTSIKHFADSVPFLERTGAEVLSDLPRPGSAIKTHMLYDAERISEQAKYIYIVRNPYDCCVSFYHHFKIFPIYQFEDGTFDEFFEMFLQGEVEFGDYFDHLISWYPHRNDANVLFLTYEDLKRDTRGWILKIAEFLGNEYGECLHGNPGILDRILEQTSVDNVRKLASLERAYQHRLLTETPPDAMPRWAELYFKAAGHLIMKKNATGDFVRKGVVGDWKNYFTASQIEKMKAKADDKLRGTDLMKLWVNLDVC